MQANSDSTNYWASTEYAYLVYKFFRKEGMRHTWGGGYRLYRLPAVTAWIKTKRYMEAILR